MNARDRTLALIVAVLWGLNFPATAIALRHYPPLLMAAVRFTLLTIPTVLFIPRPRVRWRWLIGAGFGFGFVQFAFLYLGMATGMPAGLASLVLQASAPFTVLLAAFGLRERLSSRQVAGVAVAVTGLVLIAIHRAQTAAFWPVAFTLIAACGWAVGNICSRVAAPAKPLHFTLWISIVPPLPLLAVSVLVEGPARIRTALGTAFTHTALVSDLGLLYIVVCASILGYGIWNTLMSRHPSSQVAPWSMMVPVIGVISAWVVFGETPAPAELAAGVLVVGGVLYASRSRPRGDPAYARPRPRLDEPAPPSA